MYIYFSLKIQTYHTLSLVYALLELTDRESAGVSIESVLKANAAFTLVPVPEHGFCGYPNWTGAPSQYQFTRDDKGRKDIHDNNIC